MTSRSKRLNRTRSLPTAHLPSATYSVYWLVRSSPCKFSGQSVRALHPVRALHRTAAHAYCPRLGETRLPTTGDGSEHRDLLWLLPSRPFLDRVPRKS